MRTLKFNVKDQIITADPNCDFSNLVSGTEGYLEAEFTFSDEWNKCIKVAEFIGSTMHDCIPVLLKNGKSCVIPSEMTKRPVFGIRMVGKKDTLKLTTNKVVVRQKGDK